MSKKIDNIIERGKEMKLKMISVQISVFLSDGVMNPEKYYNQINKIFDNKFQKQEFLIKINNIPDEMPIMKYSSNDGNLSFDFAKKRLNFFLNYLNGLDNKIYDIDILKKKVKEFVINFLLPVTDLSRVGIACNYYCDGINENSQFWIKKYKMPLVQNDKSEIMYKVNNVFEYNGINYNNVIDLYSDKINTKVVPVVSVDFNNVEGIKKLSNDDIDYIFDKYDGYLLEKTSNVLELDGRK